MGKIIISILLIFVGVVSASDGNGTPALKSVTVRVSVSGDTTSWTDDTRAEFDSGTYVDTATQWWGDEVRV